MSDLKAIIWDFAGVVLYSVKGSFNSLLAERLNVPESEVEKLIDSPMNTLWDINEIDDKTFYTYILNELNQPLKKITVIEHFVFKDFYVDQQILNYIKKLRESFTTVLLTNFPAHIHDFMKTDWTVDGAFDHMIASCDVKLIKPDPAIYQLTLDRIGYQAQECVFIDDREINIQPAVDLGMHGIVCKSKEQAIEDLDKLLSS